MAQLAKILLLFLCEYFAVISSNNERIVPEVSLNSEEISQFLLDFLNADTESDLQYNSAIINGKQRQNNSEQYLVTAIVSAQCRENSSSSCTPAEFVCEVLLNDEPGTRSISHKLCAPREQDVVLPATEKGFTEVVGKEKMAYATPDILTMDVEDSAQFLVVDVMSVKEWVDENGTSIYLTVKGTKNDGSDTLQFVVCEFMNGTDAEKAQCFPLETDHPDIVPDGENATEVAKAVEQLNELSPSRYVYALRSLLNIEKIVTPGSNGILTTLRVILAPTICLKRLDDDAVVERLCSPPDNGSAIVCTMTLWDRPWSTKKFLHSVPECHLEEQQVSSTQEPLVEGSATENRQPVLEEPFVTRHTFCTGCPTALNLDTPAVRELAEQSLNLLDEGTGSIYKHALVRIVKAEKQVVNGVKYNIYLDVGESSCLKGSPEDRSTCPLNNMGGDAVRTCYFEFTEQTWLQTGRQLSDSNCTTVYNRKNDNNELNNEIEPHSLENAVRQSIYDYLDAAMEEPSYSFKEISPSFRDDSEEAFFSSRRLSLIDDEIIPDPEDSSVSPVETFTSTEPGPAASSTGKDDVDAMRSRRETEIKNIVDSEREYIEELAYQAVKTLDEIDADDAKRVVTEVIDAQKQLVDGIMYFLKLRVVSTGCKEDTVRNKNDCLREQIAPTKICSVQLHKAFANTSPKNVQVVKAECFIEPSSASERLRRETGGPGVKSVESSRRRLIGGYNEITDLKSESVRNATDFAVAHLVAESTGDTSLTLVRVKSAFKQVVSGINTKVIIEMGVTNCTKTQARENEVCVLKEGETTKECTVVVWDQPWTNTRQVTQASCDENGQHRQRRSVEGSRSRLIGGYSEITDLNSEVVRNATDLAVDHVVAESTGDSSLALVRVKSAFRQVVSGINTKVIIEMGVTNCTKTQAKENGVCVLKDGEATKECTVVVWDQPWTKTRRVTQASCDETDQHRRKRFVEKRGIPGGFSPVKDLKSDSIKKTADIALAHLTALSDNEDKMIITHIIGAEIQVVSGYKTRLTLEVGFSNCSKSEVKENEVCVLKEGERPRICKFEVYEQPWTSTEVVKEASCSDDGGRRKRDRTGGYFSIGKNHEDVQKATRLGLASLAQNSNSLNKLKVIKILEAKQQIVAGTNTEVVMEVGETTCSMESPEDVESCELDESQDIMICTVVLFQQPWTQTEEITYASCAPAEKDQRRKRQITEDPSPRALTGGYYPIDVSHEDAVKAAQLGLASLAQSEGFTHKPKVARITKAEQQIVAGTNTKVEFEVVVTECLKSSSDNIESCPVDKSQESSTCTVLLFQQPWTSTEEIIEASCAPRGSGARKKRETGILLGAPADVDVNDPVLQEIADFAMSQIDKQSNSLYRQQVVEIQRARKQVVAGVMYILDLLVGYSNCRKGQETTTKNCELKNDAEKQICSVEVWDRPWLKEKKLNSFNCKAETSARSKRNSKIGKGSHDIHFGLFKDFMNIYKKQYDDKAEMKRRFHIFRANLKKIQKLQETEQGTATYGPTQFADLTSKEFKALHTGLNPSLRHENSIPMPHAKIPDISLPEEFDWRHYNVVTEVKDQGSCGSCWAFSVTGNVEGLNAIRTGKLVSLSEQELVDCDTLDNGCGGGLPDNAYRALETIGGLETEKDYPYEGENEKCHFNRTEAIVQVHGGLNISSNETKMAQWLVKNGPIAIGINANAMQFYVGGISHPWKFLCRGDDLDHGVLIVGYGVHTYPLFNRTLPFWTIKNSWGSSWGEQGYYRVYRGDGTCGVNQMASTAILV